MKTFPLRVLAPERTFFDGACTSLTVPSIERPEEIDLHRAEEMAAEARAELKAKRSAQEQAIANARIARAISRIHVKHDGK